MVLVFPQWIRYDICFPNVISPNLSNFSLGLAFWWELKWRIPMKVLTIFIYSVKLAEIQSQMPIQTAWGEVCVWMFFE